jgi:AcrR family transcriptional regulator
MKQPAESSVTQRFLDAAERLLVEVGYASISTRRLAEEAGVNHGLVHYYFGSMEQLFVAVLERYTERLIVRQRAMYAADVPFIEKWRTAMSFLDQDRVSGYQKIWLELQALAWNRPELRERLAWVRGQWTEVLTEAFGKAMEEYGLDTERFPVKAIVALVGTFNEGIILERLGGITEGHAELLDMIDRWLVKLEEKKAARSAPAPAGDSPHPRKGGDPDASALS